jgi:NitT/TauT family transport system substrate-binding protein
MLKNKILPILCFIVLVLTACTSAVETPVPTAPPTEIPEPTAEPTVEPTEPPVVYETYHLKIASYPYITEAPYFLAQELGYFAEMGLEVEFIRFERSSDVIPAIASGDLDVTTAFASAALFNAIAHDASIKIVSGKGYLDKEGCTYTGFSARTDLFTSGQLDDPANWVGLKIATEKGSAAEYGLDTLLEQNGLTPADVEIVDLPTPSRLDALQTGAIDIAGTGEPWILRIQNAGAGEMWKPMQEILPDYSWGFLLFGPTLLEQHPDVGQRFMVAFMKGLIAYNEGKTDTNVAILAQYTQLTPEEVSQICWNPMTSDGSLDPQDMVDYEQWAIERGYMTEMVTADKFWDPQFIEYAQSVLP